MQHLLILVLIPSFLFAQVKSPEQISTTIYNNIICAIGNNNPRAPEFVFQENSNGKVAYIKNKKIYLEKKVFESLAVLGEYQDDGIAHILAHELAHHYKGHAWMKRAGYSYSSSNIGHVLKDRGASIEQRLLDETQADRFAGFYSHMAGYNSISIADTVLDLIYSSYGLDSLIDGYPSLSERKSIIDERKDKLLEFTNVFDAANLALLAHNYKNASACYNYILDNQFTSCEIYNNLGLGQLLQAMDLSKAQVEYNYYYPLTITDRSRASTEITRGDVFFDIDFVVDLIHSSIENFELSSNLDDDYLPARLNKVIAELYLFQIGEGESLNLEMEIRDVTKYPSMNIYQNNLLGVYYHIQGKNFAAKKYFKKGEEFNDTYATNNLSLIKSHNDKTRSDSVFTPLIIDKIDVSTVPFLYSPPIFSSRKIPGVKLKIYQLENSLVYNYGKGNIIQKTITPGFTTNKGLSSTTNVAELVVILGEPDLLVQTFSTVFYLYLKSNSIYEIETDTIKSVITY